MSTQKDRTSWDLYTTALELRQCAESWEPAVRLLGNVRADDMAAMLKDYLRLRLESGVSHEPTKESNYCNACGRAFCEDNST